MVTQNSAGKWAGITGITGVLIWWVVATVLGLVRPTYNAVSEPISNLAAVGASFAVVQQLNFYIFGASIIVFTIGLIVWSTRGWRLLVGGLLLLVFGAGVMVAGVFQINLNNSQAATSQYHILASLVAFPSAILGISITSWGLNHDDRWPGYRNRFLPLGVAILTISMFVIFFATIMSPWEGLSQRMFLLVLTGWIVYHAFSLYRLSEGSNPSV